MRPSNRSTDLTCPPPDDDPERGSAALEFIVVGLLMLVPLVYLVVTLGLIQGQSLGVEGGNELTRAPYLEFLVRKRFGDEAISAALAGQIPD